MRCFEAIGRPKSFGVQWRVDGKAKTEFFTTAQDRDCRARYLAKARRAGELVRVPSRDEMTEWAAFKAAIGDTPWQTVIAGWKAHEQAAGRVGCTLTVQEAVGAYLSEVDALKAQGQLAPMTYRQKRHKAESFATKFGPRRLSEVKSEEIARWIEVDMGHRHPGTFNSWRKHVRTIFAHFRKQLQENPAADIKPKAEVRDDVGILTPQQTAKLFAYALDHHRDLLARLALEFFAGLRFASAQRVAKEDINFVDKGVTLPASKLKTRRRFYIDGLPECLWQWLAVADDKGWTMTGAMWMHFKSRLFRDAGVPHPHNCGRHSFATFFTAAFKDPGRTAAILAHRNQGMLWRHYNGRATQADGKLYFEITPETAASIAALSPVSEAAWHTAS